MECPSVDPTVVWFDALYIYARGLCIKLCIKHAIVWYANPYQSTQSRNKYAMIPHANPKVRLVRFCTRENPRLRPFYGYRLYHRHYYSVLSNDYGMYAAHPYPMVPHANPGG